MSAATPPRRFADPAQEAAGLLIRLGVAVLAIGVPCGAIFSRRLIFSMVPVGAALVLLGVVLSPRRADLTRLRELSRFVDELANVPQDIRAPYVGSAAFTHKGGLHVSAVVKDPHTYEHVPPESVGNKRTMPVSAQSGRANVAASVGTEGADLSRLLQDVKRREFEGYSYDDAAASFELLALRQQNKLPRYFTVEQFSVTVESLKGADGELASRSKAAVELMVAGEKIRNAGTGNGPVNALDAALRKDLGKYSPFLSDLRLVDYKVRILTSGTEAVTRVMVESADGKGNRWSTVGVSENIVDASFEALTDSIIYKLYKDKAAV